jgi:hypothetical protein
LETLDRKPCLVLVAGLPGTGKSTLAAALARQAEFTVVRSDVVRKELAWCVANAPAQFGSGIYTSEWTERTYAECLSRTGSLLFQGQRVIVDANFGEEKHRRDFFNLADRWAVPAVILICEADSESVRTRLEHRTGDASDADWAIYCQMAKQWQEPRLQTRRAAIVISTGESAEDALQAALAALRAKNLLGSV